MPDLPEYDPTQRVASCPETGNEPLRGIEISFEIPCYVSKRHYMRLMQLIEDIVASPYNQAQEGLHWVSSIGSKMTLSKRDAAVLGLPVDPNAHDFGEPTFDSSILTVGSSARGFVSEKERSKKLNLRANGVSHPHACQVLGSSRFCS